MPMFLTPGRNVLAGNEGGGDAHILDLDTAVKDGVLDGGGGGGFKGGVGEKLDLNKMVEELDLSEYPSVFICPISLEPMQDPVTLCTGQTYERSNILKWFNLGRYTCPTTMQDLWDDTVTPNTTLYHLIYTWFCQKYLQMKKRSEDVQGRTSDLLKTLKKAKGQDRIQALKELRQVVVAHASSRMTLIDEGGVDALSSLLGPFTSYAVGSEVIAILANLILNSDSRTTLLQPAMISSIVDILNEGSIETKVNCVRLLETLMEEESHIEIMSSHSLLVALMRLVRDKRHPKGHLPSLVLLKSLCLHKQIKVLLVSIGAIPQLVDLLPGFNIDCLTLVLFILDSLSSVPEGRMALKTCQKTVSTMMKLLMRVSESCTVYALSILWSVIKLSPEECSRIAVDGGLVAKLLLVIQSGCSPVVKQQAADLLKLCSLNYSDSSFISKCKLTRTIQ